MPRILYFGIYDPNYARNRVIIKGLRMGGLEIIELREKPSKLSVFKLAFRYLLFREKFDAVIVGFPGQEIMLLAKLIIRKPIIFDAFTSHYGGYILDRKKYSKKSFHAKWYRFLDKISCKLADTVLLDTNAHVDFFVKEFDLPRNKFVRLFVGSDTDIFHPITEEKGADKFLVHFHGYYNPLQGVEYIVKAAKLIEDNDIRFNLIGRGQTYEDNKKLADRLEVKNINFISVISYGDLAKYIAQSDVCLGIFGDTPKTPLVIPNKLFEALAMRKPVITANTPAVRELLSDDDALLIKAADPEALADGILKLKNDNFLRNKIADSGYRKFVQFASPGVLSQQLFGVVNKLIQK